MNEKAFPPGQAKKLHMASPAPGAAQLYPALFIVKTLSGRLSVLSCVWYNNRRAVIIPRAYRLSEAMR